jgi:hypothetical protein
MCTECRALVHRVDKLETVLDRFLRELLTSRAGTAETIALGTALTADDLLIGDAAGLS